MSYEKVQRGITVVALGLFVAASGHAQQAQHATKPPAKVAKPATPSFQPGLEPRAIDIIKAASARLAAAKT